ncbi:MAG: tRNA (adenosine(37)-N6)-dimethylallyltransferase MiaA [Anaerolineales bacterium]|nr:tRNA (adenosine(37)-N6)-dimethylallyltransferase MiaA [Anaerolineales bacterium]
MRFMLIPVVAILGPTAVGKTEAAIAVARALNGEIVSADSRLLYKGMDIGTAKPDSAVLKRIPHHLIDVTTPDNPWTMARYIEEARRAIQDIRRRGRLPLIAGGTGQYVQALLEGWEPPPAADDCMLRERFKSYVEEHGSQALHQQLSEIDPESAHRIDYRNVRRVIRALEIFELTGAPASSQKKKSPPPYRCLKVGLIRPRAELYARIDVRIESMFADGLVDEVKSLLARGYDPALPAFSAIGYRQVIDALEGKISMDEAMAAIRKLTRQFVRRQANWWKPDDASIRWFVMEQGVLDAIKFSIETWLEQA